MRTTGLNGAELSFMVTESQNITSLQESAASTLCSVLLLWDE